MSATASKQSAERRAGEEADALDRARGDVGCGQLAGVPRELRQKRCLGGTERRPGERGDDREPVDEECWAVGEDHAGGDDDECCANEVGGDHHGAPGVPVGERRRKRRHDRHEEVPHDRQHADSGRATLAVRVDGDGDGVRPVADDGSGERGLETPERRVAKDVCQRADRRARVVGHPAQVSAPLDICATPSHPARRCAGQRDQRVRSPTPGSSSPSSSNIRCTPGSANVRGSGREAAAAPTRGCRAGAPSG